MHTEFFLFKHHLEYNCSTLCTHKYVIKLLYIFLGLNICQGDTSVVSIVYKSAGETNVIFNRKIDR